MKFVCAVVMLALAAEVQSSLLTAQVAPGVSYVAPAVPGPAPWAGPWGGPWAGAHAAGVWGGIAGPLGPAGHGLWGPAGHGAWGPAGHGAWGGYPGISLSQGPGHAAAHGPGVYVAKTRGAVHTAPLAGHVNSATSVNLAPAPGTH
ncbi:adult cuticle protein 1 [Musca domestica]|uniref:Adult cuticle protein 1 n=1 Tax=Musca domestica TaxID=7370 RepID=A0A9J7CXR8_MUSDO|nr:adult cuticle protein 1 [Musca domestica]